MTDFGEAFAWPARDPGWIGKLIVMGLIGIIPIVGQMTLIGWTLGSLDNLRAGRYELAPAGFAQLGRGARVFLVQLIYAVPIGVVAALFYIPGVIIASAGNGTAAAGLGALLTGIGSLLIFAASLGLAYLQPILILRTDQGGVAAGLDFAAVFARLRAEPLKTLLAALLMYVAQLIGGLGFIVCLIGAIFTVPYGYAIVSAVLRVYEQQLSPAGVQPAV